MSGERWLTFRQSEGSVYAVARCEQPFFAEEVEFLHNEVNGARSGGLFPYRLT